MNILLVNLELPVKIRNVRGVDFRKKGLCEGKVYFMRKNIQKYTRMARG